VSAVDFVRMGVASMASVGAALGGFAASQNGEEVVGVAPTRPPVVQDAFVSLSLVPASDDLARWSEAFVAQPAALLVAPETKPWRFVGVIGEGRSAKAVFSAPDNPSQTLMSRVGDTLPDGRLIAAIASEHVLFAAPGGGGAEAASGVIGPKQIGLFSGVNGNADATAAFAAADVARAAPPRIPVRALGGRGGPEAHIDVRGNHIEPTDTGLDPIGRMQAPASAPTTN